MHDIFDELIEYQRQKMHDIFDELLDYQRQKELLFNIFSQLGE